MYIIGSVREQMIKANSEEMEMDREEMEMDQEVQQLTLKRMKETLLSKKDIETAIFKSLEDAVQEYGGYVTETNKEDILKRGHSILNEKYLFETDKKVWNKQNLRTELKKDYIDFDSLISKSNPLQGWYSYKRMADFSVLPIKNPFVHVPNRNKFVEATRELFPNVDAYNAGACLTTFRRIIENIYANLGDPTAKKQQVAFYQYSALGGTGKDTFLDRLVDFLKEYHLPTQDVHILGRWTGNEFSSNVVGLVREFFPCRGTDAETSIVKINNIIDNTNYQIEYKGQDAYFNTSRISLFINSNKLPFDVNTRRYGVVRYNEKPYSTISKEDKEKYFFERDYNKLFLQAFESCPFGETFEDVVCEKADSLNDLIFAAREYISQNAGSYMMGIQDMTIRQFVSNYLSIKNDFGKVDPAFMKKEIFKFRMDIEKAVATGLITPSTRVNGNLGYSRYNWQEIANLTTSEDSIETNLDAIENMFERTRVAFNNFLEEVPPFLDPTDDEFSSKEDHFFFKKNEYATPSATPGSFMISNVPTTEAIQKFFNKEIELSDLAKGENLEPTNFVFECDNLSKEEQKAQIETLPPEVKECIYSVTDSGNKSIHVLLKTNNTERGARKKIWTYINDTYFHSEGDSQCYNISRLTRTPNNIRDNGNKQACLYMNHAPKAFDVSFIVEAYKKEVEEKKALFAKKEYTGPKQELTVEVLQRRNPTPRRDDAISLLEGTMNHGPDTIGAICYLLGTGFTEEDLWNNIPLGTWTNQEFSGMINAAKKQLSK